MLNIKKRNILAAIITVILLICLYKLWFVKFQLEMLVIILVLGYLLSYKLVDYIADFKTIENKSRVDIIFLTIFFILLFIPMSHIDKAEISKSENRTLAKWKPLFESKNKINYNFGKNFENWFNDRFFLRNYVVKVYTLIKYNLSVNYYENKKAYINKKNNWISEFYDIDNIEANEKEKADVIYNIEKLKEFCKEKNIKCYIIVAPQKEEIYGEYLYPVLKNASKYNYSMDIIGAVKEKTGFDIIYPYNELKKASKTDMVYYKVDHHWTDIGAYEGYLKVMKQFKRDFPKVNFATIKDFNFIYTKKVKVDPDKKFFDGKTYKSLNLSDKNVLDTKYKYLAYKHEKGISYKRVNSKKSYHFLYYNNKNSKNNIKIVMLGDSFTLNLLPVITANFKKTLNIYTLVTVKNTVEKAFKIKRFEKQIMEEEPDILLIVVCEAKRLKYLFDMEKK